MRFIPLTKGKFAMVDDEDFERVNQFKWRFTKARPDTVEYAARTARVDGRRKTQLMHRFILGHTTESTDHIDGNGLNNQKANLRPCNREQNGRNRKLQIHSAPFKGVAFYPPTKTWAAYIRVDKNVRNLRKVHLGYFLNPEDAARAYDCAAIKHFGPYARTNQQIGVL